MHRWKLSLVWGVFLLGMPSAWAGNWDAKEREAKKACMLGNTKEGIEILTNLYLDSNDPTFIFNQGRCFEQNGQNEQAILRFQEFLRKAQSLPAADVASVRKRIDELQATVTNSKATQPAPTMVTASTIPPAATPTPEPLAITDPGPTPEPQQSTPAYKLWWFWTGIGVMVAGGVITAIVLSSQSTAQSPDCHQGGICVP